MPRASGCQGAEAVAGLEGETLTIAISARFAAASPGAATTIDPAWLEWLPASGTVAAASVALDPGARAWDAAFALADRVERADPARDRVAPLRTRLNLLATAAGVRPEVDLWPKLRGLSGSILVDSSGNVAGALLVLHAADPPAADRIATRVLPRLVASYLKGQEPADPADGVQRLARLSGRPLEVTRRHATVLIGWGESALAAGLGAKASPERSAAATLRASWSPTPPRRAAPSGPVGSGPSRPPTLPCASAGRGPPDPLVGPRRRRGQPRYPLLDWTPRAGPPVPGANPPDGRPRGVGRIRPGARAHASGLRRRDEQAILDDGRSMRLIDLHTDWLLQYAPEATVFDAALYPRVRERLGQSEGYLQGTWAAVLSCYRAADDWARQADPWAALGQLLARVEAEFCGRLLFTAEDVGRWLDDPEGLCWGIVGVEGFDALVRSPGDLDRLAGLFGAGSGFSSRSTPRRASWAGHRRPATSAA